MTEHSPTYEKTYEKAITTHRPAELLSRMHGFENVAKLAETLPQNARVLDVGAGASPFGKEVATLRPDISWTNFDYSYSDPAILDEANKDAPSNVEYMQGDATKLSDVYQPESFDAVFSYWLLPHLSIDDLTPAKEAAKGIFTVTKPGGLMSIGPKHDPKLFGSAEAVAIKAVKSVDLDRDDYADMIVNETKLSKSARKIQKLANEVATPYFGTTRYTRKDDGGKREIYDPKSGEYISPLSLKGAQTLGGLALTMLMKAKKVK